jgi:hypothetical protein
MTVADSIGRGIRYWILYQARPYRRTRYYQLRAATLARPWRDCSDSPRGPAQSVGLNYLDSTDGSAEKIKEDYTYVCQDIVKEFKKYDTDPYKYFARFAGEHSVTGRKYDLDIGYERFLAPEIFFNPEIYSSDFLTPLPEVVDTVIQTSPIDVRRGLYKNIVLSGGSTMFKDFGKRLQRDVKAIVDGRIAGSEQKSGSHMKSSGVEVNVISHKRQRYAVWYGGSLMASTVSIHCWSCLYILMDSPNSTMSPTANRITRSTVPRSLGVSRSLVVLSSLGCYMQEYRRPAMSFVLRFIQTKRYRFITSCRPQRRGSISSCATLRCRSIQQPEAISMVPLVHDSSLIFAYNHTFSKTRDNLSTVYASACPPLPHQLTFNS